MTIESNESNQAAPLDADELMNFAERIDALAPADAEWVGRLFQECLRARLREADLLSQTLLADPAHDGLEEQLAQIALDTAEWLKTLWTVGYMGAGSFPSEPRSAFPGITLEDVLNSALFARIRQGKRPLPFPPPTRNGSPWHELVEGPAETYTVDAEVVRDEQGQALAARIEGCADWHVIEEIAPAGENGETPNDEYIVQHQGKGPLFQLRLGTFTAELRREPPRWTRTIRRQERGGLLSYTLDWWAKEAGATQHIPLRAATWERAESEAQHWIATRFPAMYGQVSFERVE